VTTRFEEDDLLGSITSTIHEFGHANYTQGLPDEGYATPLGEARDLSVHESQSRLWENHVGRSRPFWEHFLPIARERFPELEDVSPRRPMRPPIRSTTITSSGSRRTNSPTTSISSSASRSSAI